MPILFFVYLLVGALQNPPFGQAVIMASEAFGVPKFMRRLLVAGTEI